MANEARTCERCQESRQVEMFHRDKRRKTGRHPYCKFCRSELAKKRYGDLDSDAQEAYAREYYLRNRDRILRRQKERWAALPESERKQTSRARALKHQYGLTLKEYEQMAERQGFACAICSEIPDEILVVDHDHATGDIRGLLCNLCNTALGGFRDNPRLLNAAIGYLGGQ